MMELLSPAGSAEALQAAVQNGADAVYLGSGIFNARVKAHNFSEDDLSDAVSYAHIRGVRVYLTLNTLVSDREMPDAAALIRTAAQAGVDAFIVQDLGIVSLCRQIAPEIRLHASTQMSLHSLDGFRKAEQLGLTRVVPARELSRTDLAYICRNSPLEAEVFVHGALCMCYSGQCYLSSMIGQRSGNRGRCAQPCRLPYGYGRADTKYPLSLKDNCLLHYLDELKNIGVASLKIEGRMRRPEYVAITTQIYRAALDGKAVTEEQMQTLQRVFSRQGFTDGYYTGRIGRNMFGVREEDRPEQALFAQARQTYETGEHRKIPVEMYAMVRSGENAMLAVRDDADHICKSTGPVPEIARQRPLTEESLRDRLCKTGNTPYRVTVCKTMLDDGLMLSAADLNAMRRDALARLTALRGRTAAPDIGRYTDLRTVAGPTEAPEMTVQLYAMSQLTPELKQAAPAVLYVPLREVTLHPQSLQGLSDRTSVCVVLPRIIRDAEMPELLRLLDKASALDIREALVGNLGHIAPARSRGFRIRGDFGLNLFNSRAMKVLANESLLSATVSFEMSFPQIRDLSKDLHTELIAYGRLPLMLTENCVMKNRTGTCCCSQPFVLTDRKGENFPVVRDGDTCRNVILNAKKLYLLDKQDRLQRLGIRYFRLLFTTESPMQVNSVLRACREAQPLEPGTCTRGLYGRSID